jgi:hypothetical protein
MPMRGLPTLSGALQLVPAALVVVGATVALCLGHLSEATYVALLAGGAVAAPAARRIRESKG